MLQLDCNNSEIWIDKRLLYYMNLKNLSGSLQPIHITFTGYIIDICRRECYTIFYIFMSDTKYIYMVAIIKFMCHSDTSMGVVFLCLGSTMLCLGSVWLNKDKKKKDDKEEKE